MIPLSVTRWWGVCGGRLLVSLSMLGAAGAEPKRVLMVHSFGSTSPPFTTTSTAFEATLTREMGNQVDLDAISLDMARFSHPEMQEAFAEYLPKRMSKWRPDLVVPIGSPAGRFVAQYRERLFPGIPILYTGMDQGTLPPEALQTEAAFVGQKFDVPGFVEDILQLAPYTTNVVVLIGASSLERYWGDVFRRGFEAYRNRIGFTFLQELSFDQMRERVAKLPPHSFIFLGLLLRDVTGVTVNEDEALEDLHAVANAPINGIFRTQLGLGIVGGRLHDERATGVEAARVANRILHGEPAASFPPRVLPPLQPIYDWRELRRWGIKETRLPVDASVVFRQPTLWQEHRWNILVVIAVCVGEAMLIALLAVSLENRRRVLRALSESEERFRLLVEQAPEAVFVYDCGQDRILQANPQAERVFGGSREELLGFGPQRFYTPEQPDGQPLAQSFRANLERALRGETVVFERTINNALGQQFHCEVRLVRLPAGERKLVRASFIDITHHKQAEAQAHRQQGELAHVSRVSMLGELAASVAHELSQPLGAILSNAEAADLLLKQTPLPIGEVQAILEDIRRDDERAAVVIRQMRTLLRKQELEHRPLEINSQVKEVLRFVSADAALRNTTISTKLSPELPPVQGDPVHLQQVLMNLILNAIEAMAKQPPTKRRLVVGTDYSGNGKVEISVVDCGPGIEPDKLQRLFDPFFTTKQGGIGMGLSIARRIIDAHQGSIWAENHPEGGAIFRFTLPVAKEATKT